MTNTWENDLKRGEWFEENVTRPWLLENRTDWWITDSRNHKRYGDKGGPKIVKGSDTLTLPDFRLDKPEENKSGWLDAKMKRGPFSINGDRTFYSIDPLAYIRYKKITEVFKDMTFEILLGCAYSCKLWIFDFRTVEPVWHKFDNEYVRHGQSLTPCYSSKQMTYVKMWRAYDMP